MGLFFQILGVIFLIVIVVGITAILIVRSRIRRFLRTMEDLSKTMPEAMAPVTLKLRQVVGDVDWKHKEAVEELRRPLKDLGLQSVGVFQDEAMGGLQLQAWADPSRSIYAVLYEHSQAVRPWIDFVSRYQDGSSFTVTNAPAGEEVEHPPDQIKMFKKDLGTTDLYHLFLAQRPDQPLEPTSLDATVFQEVFECEYNDESEWRFAHGSPTEAEIRAIAASTGIEYSEDVLQETRHRLQTQAMEQLEEVLRCRFLEETTLSAAEWEDARERLVIVHDRLTAEMLNELVATWSIEAFDDEAFDEEDEDEVPEVFDPNAKNFAPRAEFRRYNNRLSEDARFIKLGELKEPVAADVYRAPDDWPEEED